MQNYKEYHEKYLQNLNGTTSWETFSLIYPSFFEVFIATTTSSFILKNLIRASKIKCTLIRFLIDFFTIIYPIILTITVFNSNFIFSTLPLILTSIIILFLFYTDNKKLIIIRNEEDNEKITTRRHFVTNSRSTISVISVIAILAVDFKIFPQRFAKTETFGYSLMDVGVGLFVFSNGLIAPEITRKSQTILKSVISSAPLWLLGAARFFFTEETNYHVHVSEYGVHWNFFITLAVTKILTSCVLTIVSVNYSFVISIFVLTLHELLLQIGLRDWVLANTERSSFLLANREGIVSSLGYVGLYFLSVHFGRMIEKSKSKPIKDPKLAVKLLLSSSLLISLVIIIEKYLGISRRLANAGYCFWILFIGVFMVCLFLIGEHINKCLYKTTHKTYRIYVPLIFEAVNFNGLAFFLLANIFTGLINLSIQTLTYNYIASLIIITLYMFCTCSIISFLYIKNIKLKLW